MVGARYRCAPWAVAPVPSWLQCLPAHLDMFIVVLHVGYPPRAVFGRPLGRGPGACDGQRDERWVFFVFPVAPHSTHASTPCPLAVALRVH